MSETGSELASGPVPLFRSLSAPCITPRGVHVIDHGLFSRTVEFVFPPVGIVLEVGGDGLGQVENRFVVGPVAAHVRDGCIIGERIWSIPRANVVTA